MGVLLTDLLESNANALFAELRGKISKLADVHSSAKPGGDFATTVRAQWDINEAALKAAERVFTEYMKPPIAPNPTPNGTGVITWKERVADATAEAGHELSLDQLLHLAKSHQMTPAELEAQRVSWSKQDMD